MTCQKYDIGIIGAGIVGSACARKAALAGLKTIIIEKDFIGAGTTAAGMGHIVTLDDSEAQFKLCRHSQLLWKELSNNLPKKCEYDNCGTIWIAADDEEMNEAERKFNFYKSNGLEVELLTPEKLYIQEPHLTPGLKGGLLVKDDSVVYPPAAAEYLISGNQDLPIKSMTNQNVNRIEESSIFLDDNTQIECSEIIIACGINSVNFAPNLPLFPKKGYLAVTDRYPGLVNHQLVELSYLKSAHASSSDSVAFNIQPRSSGQLIIGSSRELNNRERDINPKLLHKMLQTGAKYFSELPDLKILRCWSGFRPSTPDNLPYIGPAPGKKQLWLATGHEGLGITTSMGTADILLDIIQNQTTKIPHQAYLPERSLTNDS